MKQDLMVERILDAVTDVARSGKLSSALTTFLLGHDTSFDDYIKRKDMIRGMIRAALEAAAPTWTAWTAPGWKEYGGRPVYFLAKQALKQRDVDAIHYALQADLGSAVGRDKPKLADLREFKQAKAATADLARLAIPGGRSGTADTPIADLAAWAASSKMSSDTREQEFASNGQPFIVPGQFAGTLGDVFAFLFRNGVPPDVSSAINVATTFKFNADGKVVRTNSDPWRESIAAAVTPLLERAGVKKLHGDVADAVVRTGVELGDGLAKRDRRLTTLRAEMLFAKNQSMALQHRPGMPGNEAINVAAIGRQGDKKLTFIVQDKLGASVYAADDVSVDETPEWTAQAVAFKADYDRYADPLSVVATMMLASSATPLKPIEPDVTQGSTRYYVVDKHPLYGDLIVTYATDAQSFKYAFRTLAYGGLPELVKIVSSWGAREMGSAVLSSRLTKELGVGQEPEVLTVLLRQIELAKRLRDVAKLTADPQEIAAVLNDGAKAAKAAQSEVIYNRQNVNIMRHADEITRSASHWATLAQDLVDLRAKIRAADEKAAAADNKATITAADNLESLAITYAEKGDDSRHRVVFSGLPGVVGMRGVPSTVEITLPRALWAAALGAGKHLKRHAGCGFFIVDHAWYFFATNGAFVLSTRTMLEAEASATGSFTAPLRDVRDAIKARATGAPIALRQDSHAAQVAAVLSGKGGLWHKAAARFPWAPYEGKAKTIAAHVEARSPGGVVFDADYGFGLTSPQVAAIETFHRKPMPWSVALPWVLGCEWIREQGSGSYIFDGTSIVTALVRYETNAGVPIASVSAAL